MVSKTFELHGSCFKGYLHILPSYFPEIKILKGLPCPLTSAVSNTAPNITNTTQKIFYTASVPKK